MSDSEHKHEATSLLELGFHNHFIQQLSLEEWDDCIPARIIEQHKSQLILAIENNIISLGLDGQPHIDGAMTVGDWLLLEKHTNNQNDHYVIKRLLERQTLFSRKAPGSKLDQQLIAANVDTLFIVSSANHDFNLNRFERYLVLANDAHVEPVIILTKTDLCESQDKLDEYIKQVEALDPLLMVVPLNALDENNLSLLSPWCQPGKTLALLGSSGVGKSTLANLLLGENILATAGIREDDSKGRHTTTGRSLHIIPKSNSIKGGLLLDTPGMRELQLANVEDGIEETFADILALAQACKFSDCDHDMNLPENSGCAVQAAIKNNELEPRRLLSYQKLLREDALNSASLAQRRDKDKQFGKMIKQVMKDSKKKRGH